MRGITPVSAAAVSAFSTSRRRIVLVSNYSCYAPISG
jgi:hypothetical protein